MSVTLTHTQLRKAISDLQRQVRRMRVQINELLNYSPKRVKEITDAVEQSYGLEPGIVYTHKRGGRISEARRVAITIIKKNLKITQSETSRLFGCDQSMVPAAVRKVREHYGLYPGFRDKFDGICERLGVKKGEGE